MFAASIKNMVLVEVLSVFGHGMELGADLRFTCRHWRLILHALLLLRWRHP